jgi:hypothetical protein
MLELPSIPAGLVLTMPQLDAAWRAAGPGEPVPAPIAGEST